MKLLAVIFIVFSSGLSAKLPSNFKRCNLNDSKCLKEAVNDAIPKFKDGLPEYGLAASDPLLIPEIVIGAGKEVVQLTQTYKNALLSGLSEVTLLDFKIDLANGKITMKFVLNELILRGTYVAKGKILLLPVNGNGDFKITLDKPVSILTFDVETFTKNDMKHIRGTSAHLDLDVSHASYRFENLFGDNREIGENLNKVLNDNWRSIFDELVPSYVEAYAKVIMNMMNRLFAKVSMSEMFLDQ